MDAGRGDHGGQAVEDWPDFFVLVEAEGAEDRSEAIDDPHVGFEFLEPLDPPLAHLKVDQVERGRLTAEAPRVDVVGVLDALLPQP